MLVAQRLAVRTLQLHGASASCSTRWRWLMSLRTSGRYALRSMLVASDACASPFAIASRRCLTSGGQPAIVMAGTPATAVQEAAAAVVAAGGWAEEDVDEQFVRGSGPGGRATHQLE